MNKPAQTAKIFGDAYWLALGKFIQQFSEIEAAIQIALWVAAETPPEIAQAVFSGVRTDTAMSHIRRIFEARQEPLPPPLVRAFSQLQIINAVRNDIVHYGSRLDGVDLIASNSLLALPGKARRTLLSPAIMDDMTADLRTIQACLTLVFFPKDAPPHVADALAQAGHAPWRYTPPAPRKDQPATPPR